MSQLPLKLFDDIVRLEASLLGTLCGPCQFLELGDGDHKSMEGRDGNDVQL